MKKNNVIWYVVQSEQYEYSRMLLRGCTNDNVHVL